MNIRFHPNSHQNRHRRGVPCGRPVALQRRIHSFNCRPFSPIGRPQGTPLQWEAKLFGRLRVLILVFIATNLGIKNESKKQTMIFLKAHSRNAAAILWEYESYPSPMSKFKFRLKK